jgi:hypothetical protein
MENWSGFANLCAAETDLSKLETKLKYCFYISSRNEVFW